MSTSHTSAESSLYVAGFRAVLLGGLCAIGISCFYGSVFAGIWLRVSMWNGASLQEAYAALMASSGSPGYWMAMVSQALAGAIGGYIAARGGDKPIAYATGSSLVYLSFVGVMYINPSSQAVPFWYLLLSLVVPIVSAALGGVLYVRKT
jgi:hypothetical protein